MQYELKIDLIGGKEAEDILTRLKGLTNALGSGGSIFGKSGGTKRIKEDIQDITPEINEIRNSTILATATFDKFLQIKGLQSGISKLKSLKEEFGDMIPAGQEERIELMISRYTANISKATESLDKDRIKAMMMPKIGSGNESSGGTKGALAQFINQRHSSVGYEVDKDFWLSMFPPIKPDKSIQQFIEQRHKQSGYGIDKSFWLSMFPPQITKGLRDVSGSDLAKVQAMGDINDIFETGKMHGPDLGGIMRSNWKKKQEGDANAFKMDMMSLALPLGNPGSLWSTMWGAKNIFKGMNTERGAAFRASKLGGMSAVGATALLVGGATAIGLALKALTVIVKETIAAYEYARQIYAKSLMSGLGIQFTVRRSMLAEIMGVSEQDVFRFGAQMAYLNPRLKEASDILARTATPLTQVSWEFKILQADILALFADIANTATPAILNLGNALDNLVKTAIYLYDHAPKSLISGAASGLATGIGNLTLGVWGTLAAKLGLKINSELSKTGGMPQPQSWMKQLPASSWEKMGLVVGGGTQNYAKETAKHTKEMAQGIKTMVKYFSGHGRRGVAPFGLDPKTANP